MKRAPRKRKADRKADRQVLLAANKLARLARDEEVASLREIQRQIGERVGRLFGSMRMAPVTPSGVSLGEATIMVGGEVVGMAADVSYERFPCE